MPVCMNACVSTGTFCICACTRSCLCKHFAFVFLFMNLCLCLNLVCLFVCLFCIDMAFCVCMDVLIMLCPYSCLYVDIVLVVPHCTSLCAQDHNLIDSSTNQVWTDWSYLERLKSSKGQSSPMRIFRDLYLCRWLCMLYVAVTSMSSRHFCLWIHTISRSITNAFMCMGSTC